MKNNVDEVEAQTFLIRFDSLVEEQLLRLRKDGFIFPTDDNCIVYIDKVVDFLLENSQQIERCNNIEDSSLYSRYRQLGLITNYLLHEEKSIEDWLLDTWEWERYVEVSQTVRIMSTSHIYEEGQKLIIAAYYGE